MKAAQKEAMAPIKEKQKAFAESMKPFMERNKGLIETSIAPIKDNKDMWKEDKNAMLDDFLSEEDNAKRKAKKAKKADKAADRTEDQMNRSAAKKALSFVLWSGEMKNGRSKKKGGQGKKSKKG